MFKATFGFLIILLFVVLIGWGYFEFMEIESEKTGLQLFVAITGLLVYLGGTSFGLYLIRKGISEASA